MNYKTQIIQLIDRLSAEKMWTTLNENELIKLKLDTTIYCSFIGKNSPYFAIELFLGIDGQNAMIERLNSIYYPDFIYRYRQNSIVILIDSRFEHDKLEQPIIKYYRKNARPTTNLDTFEQFKLLEYLSALYDAISLMKSQNIFGLFDEKCIEYYYDDTTQQYMIRWEELPSVLILNQSFKVNYIPTFENDGVVELDYFKIDFHSNEFLFAVINHYTGDPLLLTFVDNEEDTLQKLCDDVLNRYGLFEKVIVRDLQMAYYMKQYGLQVEVSSQLNQIDLWMEQQLKEE